MGRSEASEIKFTFAGDVNISIADQSGAKEMAHRRVSKASSVFFVSKDIFTENHIFFSTKT